jgi:hypothetical protein
MDALCLRQVDPYGLTLSWTRHTALQFTPSPHKHPLFMPNQEANMLNKSVILSYVYLCRYHKRFGETYRLHLYTEDGSIMLLRNVGKYLISPMWWHVVSNQYTFACCQLM